MPLYKLHEAPRAPSAFGGPSAGHNSAHRHLHHTAMPQHVPSASLQRQAHQRMILPAPPAHQQKERVQHHHTAPNQPPRAKQHNLGPETTSKEQHSRLRPLAMEKSHYGHSLYFIEHLFPSKLWRILDDAERCGYDDVLSWVDDGMAFQIHDRENVIPILEKYFNMSKYKSFLRQLQAYGFHRAIPNPKDDPCRESKPKIGHCRGKWRHELFRRDKMNLCNQMTRDGGARKEQKVKAQANAMSNTRPGIRKVFASNTASRGQPPVQSPKPMSGANHHSHISQSQSAIVRHQQQQQQQQGLSQHERQKHLQHLHNRTMHKQPSAVGAIYHHDPRFPPQSSLHHPQQLPPGVHFSNTLIGTVGPVPGIPAPGMLAPVPGMLGRVAQQKQDERLRHQLQRRIDNGKGRLSPAPSQSAPGPAGKTSLGGVNFNSTSHHPPPVSPSGTSVKAPISASAAVSEATNELRQAEIALVERRRRLLEAQELAKKEIEAEAMAHAEHRFGMATMTVGPSAAMDAAKSPGGTPVAASPGPVAIVPRPQANATGGVSISSLLEDLDNAFKSTAIPPPHEVVDLALAKPPSRKDTGSSDLHRITDQELLRARDREVQAPPLVDYRVHPPQPNRPQTTKAAGPAASDSSAGPTGSEREVILARLNAMERIRLGEQEEEKERQQLLMNLASSVSPKNRNLAVHASASDVIRDAIRNAAVGLISRDTTASSTGNIERINPPGILSKEMMEIFEKTARAAISSKSMDGSDRSSSPPTDVSRISPPLDGSSPSFKTSVVGGPGSPKSIAGNVAPRRNPHKSDSSVISSSELEAARALMRIPGTVIQASGDSLTGHWELVQPDDLKKGTSLAKALPEAVTKSSELSHEAYKNLALKMHPPNVMSIPESWDARKEPVYLVVDPANAATASIPPTSQS